MTKKNGEKRKYPRVKTDLSLKIKHENADIITTGENVSLSGIYCKSDKPIPLMSQIEILLLIPNGDKPAKSVKTTGVIVREHPVIIDNKIIHYDIAIYFDSLSQKDKKIITQMISSKIEDDKREM